MAPSSTRTHLHRGTMHAHTHNHYVHVGRSSHTWGDTFSSSNAPFSAVTCTTHILSPHTQGAIGPATLQVLTLRALGRIHSLPRREISLSPSHTHSPPPVHVTARIALLIGYRDLLWQSQSEDRLCNVTYRVAHTREVSSLGSEGSHLSLHVHDHWRRIVGPAERRRHH